MNGTVKSSQKPTVLTTVGQLKKELEGFPDNTPLALDDRWVGPQEALLGTVLSSE
jgi:hypothetical protein